MGCAPAVAVRVFACLVADRRSGILVVGVVVLTVFVRWFRLLVLILRRVTIQHDEAHDKENDSYNHHHDCSNRIQRVRFIKSEGVDEQEERDQDPRDAGEELQRECFFSRIFPSVRRIHPSFPAVRLPSCLPCRVGTDGST